MGDGFSSQCGSLSQFVISHPGQHSLAIPSWVDAMSTNQKAPFGWGVKAGMVRVWVADKTVWSHCYTRAISECFRDEELLIKHYTNSSIYFSCHCFSICGSGSQWLKVWFIQLNALGCMQFCSSSQLDFVSLLQTFWWPRAVWSECKASWYGTVSSASEQWASASSSAVSFTTGNTAAHWWYFCKFL